MSIDIPKHWIVVEAEAFEAFLGTVNWRRDDFGFHVMASDGTRFGLITKGKCHIDPGLMNTDGLPTYKYALVEKTGARCSYCGSETISVTPCSACMGTGKSRVKNVLCVCGGAGTHEAELRGLNAGVREMYRDLQEIIRLIQSFGYNCNNPQGIAPAIKRLHEQCDDARDECLKLKKELRNKK